jgi:hypothetical protein
MAVWRMRIARWIPRATDTHSQYVILIAVPLQQRLHERASMLHYAYSACLAFGGAVANLHVSVHRQCNLQGIAVIQKLSVVDYF